VGERVDMAGEHYQIANAAIAPLPVQQPLPILMAAGQRRMLELAAREANIVALGVPPDASEAHVAQMVDWLCDAAGERFPEIELNLNLMAVGGNMPRYLHRTMGQAAAQLAESDAIPVLKGSTDAMAGQLLSLRERFGISYIMVSDELADAFAPVVARLAGS
jgi:alkanesulfonate monooxygenase SsuD/methylene tetrahydromethanopterin reductase-like flavin-dependent oxidoreductase (luciferase family)